MKTAMDTPPIVSYRSDPARGLLAGFFLLQTQNFCPQKNGIRIYFYAIISVVMKNLPLKITAALLRMEDAWHKAKTNPWIQGGVFFGLLIMIGFFVAQPVFATNGTTTEPSFSDRMLLWFASFAMAIAGAITELIVALLDAVIRLMMYNNFVSSPVVGAGWSIVRDSVNIFFVVVLVVVAIGTIFGTGRFEWHQVVPRILIFAIVINFSRTLCGIMIDFGQVVMLTFANSLQSIAAGNFIYMLRLNEIYAISTSAGAFEDVQNAVGAPQAFDWFAAGLAAVFMVVMVFVTIVALAAILVWRIVMLWVLVTLAPLAWFAGAIQKVVQNNAYTDWWKKFVCAVGIGPLLTFFLWLTLAVAGAGNIAARGGFIETTTQSNLNVSGNLSKIFEVENLMSFILGLGMLYAGFEAAATFCSGGSKFVGQTLGKAKGVGDTIGKGAVALGAGAAGYAAAGARKVGGLGASGLGLGARAVAGELEKSKGPASWVTKRGRAKLFRNMAKSGVLSQGLAGRLVGSRLEASAEQLEKESVAETREVGKRWEGQSKRNKINQIMRHAKNPPKTAVGRKEAMLLLQEALADKSSRRDLEAAGVLDDLWNEYGKEMSDMFRSDESAKANIKAFKKARPDLGGKWKVSSWDDIKGLDVSAIAKLREKHDSGEIDLRKIGSAWNGVNALQAITQGKLGSLQRDVFGEAELGDDGKTVVGLKDAEKTAMGASLEGMGSIGLERIDPAELAKHVTVDALRRNSKIAKFLMKNKNLASDLTANKNGGGVMYELFKRQGGLNLDADSGNFGQTSDVQGFTEMIQQNPGLLGTFSQGEMAKVLENEQTRAAMINGLGTGGMEALAAQIKKNPGDNRHSEEAVHQLFEMARNEASSDEDRATVQELSNQFTQKSSGGTKSQKRRVNRLRNQLNGETTRQNQIAAELPALESRVAEIKGQIDQEGLSDEVVRDMQGELDELEANVRGMEAMYQQVESRKQEMQGEIDRIIEDAKNSMAARTKALEFERDRLQEQVTRMATEFSASGTSAQRQTQITEETERVNKLIQDTEKRLNEINANPLG